MSSPAPSPSPASDPEPLNAYQAPTAELETGMAPSFDEPVLAGRGKRLAAQLVDGLCYAVCATPAAVLAFHLDKQGSGDFWRPLLVVAGLIGFVVLGVLAWNLVWLHKYGQSVGKRALSIRIVRMDGSRAGLGRVFGLRMVLPQLISAIPILGGLFGLLDVLFIFREDRRCIHDLMADTQVIEA